ncbi:conjugal transfer protein TrbN, partial [Neisseria gonorrhoeae]
KQYVSPTTVYVPRTIRVVERSPEPEPETVQN